MSTDHIVKAFDQDLRHLDNMIAEMGGLAEVQIADAIDALIRRDEEKARAIVAADRRIDDLENEIDGQTIRLLALRQPMAEDLRIVITALKTASIIERIGDYAKNIAKRTIVISQAAPPAGAARTIGRMGAVVQEMLKTVLDAYVARDALIAEEVRLRDEEVDALHTSLFRELLTYMMEDPRNITSCTHLLFVAKNLERIGDHITNVAENIIFLVKGEIPEEDRPKGDESSYAVAETGDGGAT